MTLDQWLSIGNIFVAVIIAAITYRISHKLSSKNKYDHEIYISDRLSKILGKKVILANVRKYNSNNDDTTNETYFKQACGLEYIIPVYGVAVSLRGGNNGFEKGLIPFEWIEYVRPCDSEDTSAIMVCKFKGIKWHKNFKSPIREFIK